MSGNSRGHDVSNSYSDPRGRPPRGRPPLLRRCPLHSEKIVYRFFFFFALFTFFVFFTLSQLL
jgi:hypothetical protein